MGEKSVKGLFGCPFCGNNIGVNIGADNNMGFELYADDGRGNVAQAIAVKPNQKFWFKGFVGEGAGKRVDIWFNEYEQNPPHNYVKSWWLATVETNQEGYFDTYPLDICTIKKTSRKDASGNFIYELYESKLGKIWEGIILKTLEFQATSNSDKSNIVTVAVLPSTFLEDYFNWVLIGTVGVGLAGGVTIGLITKKPKSPKKEGVEK